MLHNYNSNTIVLVPKFMLMQLIILGPTVLTNFKFKIISKILVDRLAKILSSIISLNQRGFIHGRKTKDCIYLTLEIMGVLHNNFGGNIALKIDTNGLSFILRVLKVFGLNKTLCN